MTRAGAQWPQVNGQPPAGVLRCPANTRRLLGQSFEHAQNLSVGKPDLHAPLRVSPGEIRVKY